MDIMGYELNGGLMEYIYINMNIYSITILRKPTACSTSIAIG
jgi:hypothetical protein